MPVNTRGKGSPTPEENILVFDTGLETPCVGHWIIIACILLRWYCRPKNLEKRPRYLRTRYSELEALNTKPEVYRVSRSLRRCVALATIRKGLKAWRAKTKNEKYDRISHVVGIAFLLIVMFQSVAEGSAVPSVTSTSANATQHHNETALMNATNIHTDMNQLAALNDADLKEFIGSLAVELRQLKRENVEIRIENAEIKSTNADVIKENVKMREENAVIKTLNAKITKENAQIIAENAERTSRMDFVESAYVEAKRELAEMKMKNTDIRNQMATIQVEVNFKSLGSSIKCRILNLGTYFEVGSYYSTVL
eukprot:SAG31_NODE_7486_length_1675_cov_9.617386_1_plen_309_part_01